LKIYTFHWNLR